MGKVYFQSNLIDANALVCVIRVDFNRFAFNLNGFKFDYFRFTETSFESHFFVLCPLFSYKSCRTRSEKVNLKNFKGNNCGDYLPSIWWLLKLIILTNSYVWFVISPFIIFQVLGVIIIINKSSCILLCERWGSRPWAANDTQDIFIAILWPYSEKNILAVRGMTWAWPTNNLSDLGSILL